MATKLSPIEKRIKDLTGDTKDDPIDVIRDLTEEEAERYECEKFRYYEPNGKCEEYINAVGSAENFIILFSAANGVGKTAASANIVAHICFGKESENKYFNLPLFKAFPFPKKGRIVSDPTNIEKNVIPALKEWFPEGRYKTRKGNKKYESIWETDNGFDFDIMTYDQDPKEFEGATLGWIWLDEIPTESIFKALVARLRKGGVIFISATPITGSAWLYDHIIANPDKDMQLKGQRVYIEADVEAACKQHGIRGHLEHEHIQRMIAEYSEDEKQARIYGKFQHLVGLRFKTFTRNVHVIRPFDIDRQNFCVYEALDPHPRNPDMVNWLAVDSRGRKIICNELWIKCQGGTEELSQRIKEKADMYRIVRRIADPSAFITDQHTEKSLATRLNKFGLVYEEATKNRVMSDRRIEDALAYQKFGEEYIKSPELYIFDTCLRTIYEFEHLRWEEWQGKIADRKDQREKAMDKDDHSIENIGRLLFQEPQFIPKSGEDGLIMPYKNPDPFDTR